jgi:hypothetical protein
VESGHGHIEMLSRHFPGGTEETHKKNLSGYPVSQPRFEHSSSELRVKSATAAASRSKRVTEQMRFGGYKNGMPVSQRFFFPVALQP